jgi:photosystem II stability/assembly factor-like uncharacterized protein
MKKKMTLLILLILSIIITTCGCDKKVQTLAKPSNPSWKVSSIIQTAYPNNISCFVNKNVGVTVGLSGEVHYTKNCGKDWMAGSNSSLCLFGIYMLNDKIGWACGNGSYVIKTTNGGSSWRSISSFGEHEPNHPRYLSFVDENTGWIATATEFNSNGKSMMLSSTKDSGKTWSVVNLPKDINKIVAINLRTNNDGYILDKSGNLYITADGGKSFNKQPLNIEDAFFTLNYAPYVALKFSDEKNAFIAYSNKNGKLQTARSNDGGKIWVKENIPDLSMGALSLSPDGKVLTLTPADGSIKILKYE